MRSTPWTCGIPTIVRYELRDADARVLGYTPSRAAAIRMLEDYVGTYPGNDEDIRLVSVGNDGSDVLWEDVFDIEVDALH